MAVCRKNYISQWTKNDCLHSSSSYFRITRSRVLNDRKFLPMLNYEKLIITQNKRGLRSKYVMKSTVTQGQKFIKVSSYICVF